MNYAEHPKQTVTQEILNNWFTHHPPKDDQLERYEQLRRKGLALAATIANNCPPSADTTAAIRLVRQAIMQANQAIACGE